MVSCIYLLFLQINGDFESQVADLFQKGHCQPVTHISARFSNGLSKMPLIILNRDQIKMFIIFFASICVIFAHQPVIMWPKCSEKFSRIIFLLLKRLQGTSNTRHFFKEDPTTPPPQSGVFPKPEGTLHSALVGCGLLPIFQVMPPTTAHRSSP